MSTHHVLQSLIAGRWIGTQPGSVLASAIDGSTVAHTHADKLDFEEAVEFARRRAVPALLALDFQQRAAIVVCRFPDTSFADIGGYAVGTDHFVNSVKLGVGLIILDELPLLLKGFEINVGRAAVFLVHQQQRIQALHFHPPLLQPGLGFAEGRARGLRRPVDIVILCRPVLVA